MVTSNRARAEEFFMSHGFPHGAGTKLIFHECDLSQPNQVENLSLILTDFVERSHSMRVALYGILITIKTFLGIQICS